MFLEWNTEQQHINLDINFACPSPFHLFRKCSMFMCIEWTFVVSFNFIRFCIPAQLWTTNSTIIKYSRTQIPCAYNWENNRTVTKFEINLFRCYHSISVRLNILLAIWFEFLELFVKREVICRLKFRSLCKPKTMSSYKFKCIVQIEFFFYCRRTELSVNVSQLELLWGIGLIIVWGVGLWVVC